MERPRSQAAGRAGVVVVLVAGACGTASSPAPSAPAATAAASAPARPRRERAAAPASRRPRSRRAARCRSAGTSEIQRLDPALGYDVDVVAGRAAHVRAAAGLRQRHQARRRCSPTAMPTVSADGKTYTFKLRTGVNFVKADGTRAARDDGRRRDLLDQPGPRPEPQAEPVAGLVRLLRQHRRRGRRASAARPRPPPGSRSSTRRRSRSTSSRPTRRSSTSSPRRSPRSCPRSSPARTRPPSSRPAGRHRAVPVQELHQGPAARPSWRTRATGRPASRTSTRSTSRSGSGRQRDAPAGPGRPARHDGRPAPGRLVHPDHDRSRLQGPDRPPHAGRHRLPVHGHPAAEQRAAVSNVKVRQAVNYAIDKDAILQISHGAGVEAELHLPAGHAGLRPDLQPVPATTSAKAKR